MSRGETQAEIPKQAMVLAAGQGLRMRPLTEDRAKPALPLMNRPLLLHVLDFLARHGVRKAVVNLHARPESVTALLATGAPAGMQVETSFEPELLGTGGGIRAALGHFDRAAPLLVVNADSLAHADLRALASAHAASGGAGSLPATLAVRGREPDDTYSTVRIDGQNRVCGIGDAGAKGEPATFIGLHIVTPDGIARLPAAGPSEIVRDVYIPHLRAGGCLGAFRHTGWWIEAGSPALYHRAHLRLLREPEFLDSLPEGCGSRVASSPPSWLGPGVEGAGESVIEESVLGAGCRIGAGARVTRSLLGAGALVGRGATIVDSIIWEGVEIAERESVNAMLVMRGSGRGGELRRVPLT